MTLRKRPSQVLQHQTRQLDTEDGATNEIARMGSAVLSEILHKVSLRISLYSPIQMSFYRCFFYIFPFRSFLARVECKIKKEKKEKKRNEISFRCETTQLHNERK